MSQDSPASIPAEVFYLIALILFLGIALSLHQVIAGRIALGLFFGAITLLFGGLCAAKAKRPRVTSD